MKEMILKELEGHLATTQKVIETLMPQIEAASKMAIETLKAGGKVLIFGNGGSAADAQHIAAELTGRY